MSNNDFAEIIPGPLFTAAPQARSFGRSNLLKTILKVVFSGALIYWILRDTDLREIGAAVRQANMPLLTCTVLLSFLFLYFRVLRWRMLLRTCGSTASVPFLFRSYLVSRFFNNFLPSTIGGDAYRAVDTCRLGQSKSNALSIIFVDRFLGLVILVLFSMIALMISHELIAHISFLPLWVAALLAGMMLMVWVLFFPPQWMPLLFANACFKFGSKLNSAFQALFAFKGQRRLLFKALALSAVIQASMIFNVYLVAIALGISISLTGFIVIVPLATLIMMLPISINGIGLRENIYVYFFAAYAVPKPEALAFVWVIYGLTLLQGVVGGVVYALRR